MSSLGRIGTLLVAGAVAAGTAVAAPPAFNPAPAHADPAPAKSRIVGAQWQGDHQVDLSVYSAAMNDTVTVQLLLARDWHADPKAKFPTLYLLDGMRARDDRSGWLLETNAADFYRDKNVTVALPVGGQSSWYTDWRRPDNGKNYKWETFLAKELPPLLQQGWRATDVRAAAGVSMGGTAAFTLAARNKGLYRFAGSYSGILSTSSPGTPESIGIAMRDAGGFNADAMYGPPTDPAWAQHDPLKLAEKLRGVSLYFSSGNGSGGTGAPTDLQAMALEVLARSSNQAFAIELNRLGIPANALYRPSGNHSWPYWQFENAQAWPQVQSALGVGNPKPCGIGGAIAEAAPKTPTLGSCVTVEYPVPGGRAQDFRGGQVVWSADTGAQVVGGAIGGAYLGAGGPGGPLGYPTSGEQALPDKKGRYQQFEGGTVYWSPQTGARAVRGAIRAKYAALNYERSPLGLPVGDETKLAAGAFQRFQGGQIYWSPKSPATVVNNGPIFAEWGRQGYEGGRLGYPVADSTPIPGGFEQRFERGVIALVNGIPTVR
ncbi:esterase [Tsukamurella pulmonis]|uniref:alpha/beta hydrolase-fold protein n=1 Tax=Tsukamurella pulmonis TaxID=47312 RepID=UPI00079283F9|nr:alpha/beta hydrolase-fold protein [Tsukamurella pulmonis]KXP11824.1 esterase [Tsukamurella pulmonis]RDH10407.1 esterase [Tsukamurella pulmonis]